MQTYKTFRSVEESTTLKSLLSDNNITFEFKELIKLPDPTFTGGNGLEDRYAIMLETESIDRVNKLIENQTQTDALNLEKDHYLLTFSDEELLEILMKPDEWSPADFQSAKALLNKKGKIISDELISAMKNNRLKDLSKQEEGKLAWLILGYISACLGGLIGIFIGLNYMSAKQRLPNGEKALSYTPKTRTHGLFIFSLGMSVMIICILNHMFSFITLF